MFKKRFNPDTINTTIGDKSKLNGSINSEGTIRIEGTIEGDVEAGGDIIIGENAFIKGNLTARNIQLSGIVEGNVNCKGILHIMSTAKLTGDIEIYSIITDEGGLFYGECKMIESPKNESSNTKNKNNHYKKSTSATEYNFDKDS